MSLVITPLPVTIPTRDTRVWTDQQGGEPLRCCLRDSRPGDRVRLGAATPPGPAGAYLETGPVFLHADDCAGPADPGYPEEFRSRPQVFRAYGADGRIVGGEVVEPGTGQEAVAERLLADPAVAFVHSRNVVYGCYMFAITRGD